MTNPRQALEEAFKVIHPAPRPIRHAYQPDGSHWPVDGIGPYTEEYGAWSKALTHFRRFLDAEAWTDAAMMLVDQRAKSSALRKAWADVSEKLALHIRYMRDDVDYSAEIALALAQACLKDRENSDG